MIAVKKRKSDLNASLSMKCRLIIALNWTLLMNQIIPWFILSPQSDEIFIESGVCPCIEVLNQKDFYFLRLVISSKKVDMNSCPLHHYEILSTRLLLFPFIPKEDLSKLIAMHRQFHCQSYFITRHALSLLFSTQFLCQIHLVDCQLTDHELLPLFKYSHLHLQHLQLDHNLLGNKTISRLILMKKRFPVLKYLSLICQREWKDESFVKSKITNKTVSVLASITTLELINLSFNEIGLNAEILKYFEFISNDIILKSTKIQSFPSMTSLRHQILKLSGSKTYERPILNGTDIFILKRRSCIYSMTNAEFASLMEIAK